MENTFYDYKFKKILEIKPETDISGNIREFFPQKDYKNSRNIKLHKYGDGPFCRFQIPAIHAQGVYILCIDGKPEYVGECEDLTTRWNAGYANISPRNCFDGGQSTNCRINNIIFENSKSGKTIELFFKELTDRFALEFELISKIKPKFNKTIGKPSLSNEKIVKISKSEKISKSTLKSSKNTPNKNYQKLAAYLTQAPNEITLNFNEIQQIIDSKLPSSAFKYKAWWSNGGQTHSHIWTDVGYKVIKSNPGTSITFKRLS